MVPKNLTELLIWMGMQFPVLIAAAYLVRWTLRHSEGVHDKRIVELRSLHNAALAEKELRITDRDKRIAELDTEMRELRAKHSRSKKPPDEGDKP